MLLFIVKNLHSFSFRCFSRWRRRAAGVSQVCPAHRRPSLMQWEKYKVQPHDHWWANFVRRAFGRAVARSMARTRDPWLIYKQGYIDRGVQGKWTCWGSSIPCAKFNLNLVLLPQRRGRDQLFEQRTTARPDEGGLRNTLATRTKPVSCSTTKAATSTARRKSFLHQSQFVGINRTIFTPVTQRP